MLKKITLLNVGITNETTETIINYLFVTIPHMKKKWYIVTPNPEMLVYAHRHRSFQDILNNAKIALPDGIGVFVASGLLGNKLEERIPGVDFMEEICKQAQYRSFSVGFLGGKRGVAKKTAEQLLKKYPSLRVRWFGEEWVNEKKGKQSYISNSDPIDLLFVAFGFPKQEEWIVRNLDKIPVKAAMGVGGAFDYLSGEVIRAPFMIQAIGFEWLFRLIRQPWRLKRQLALFQFIGLLFKK